MKQRFCFLSLPLCFFLTSFVNAQNNRFISMVQASNVYLLNHSTDYLLVNFSPYRGLNMKRMRDWGNLVWEKQLPLDTIQGMKLLPDNGCLFAGAKKNQVRIIRTDSSGNVVWVKNYGATYLTGRLSVGGMDLAADGSFLIAFQLMDRFNGSTEFYVFSADSVGNLQWVRALKGTSPSPITVSSTLYCGPGSFISNLGEMIGTDPPFTVCIRSDATNPVAWTKASGRVTGLDGFIHMGKNFAIADRFQYYDSNNNLWIYAEAMVLDSAMNILDRIAYQEGAGGYTDIHTTSDGGLVIGGNTLGNGGIEEYATLTKTDASLHVEWMKEYAAPSSVSSGTPSSSICQTPDNGFLVGARDFVFKTDSVGKIACNDYPLSESFGSPSTPTSSGVVIVKDTVTLSVTSDTLTALNTTLESGYYCFVSGIQEIKQQSLLDISPNPSTGHFLIRFDMPAEKTTLQIYSVLGELILSRELFGTFMDMDISDQAPGVYSIIVQNEKGRIVKKMVKE